MTLEALEGRVVGPGALAASAGAVAEFVAATGDDATRWRDAAPPGFAAAALFAVAPAFLAEPEVARHGRSLLHAEQSFGWSRALLVGEEVEVRGRVAGVRSRGPLYMVGFEVDASGPGGPWLEGSSTFLLSAEAAASSAEEAEPGFEARAEFDPATPFPFPAAGEALPPLRRSASRSDLVRYAVASGDANPIHQDHEAARGAGLPGVVVHGLLLACWLFQAAARFREGPHPLQRARVRFRQPLRPAVAAVIGGSVGAGGPGLDLALEAGGVLLATATVAVTP